MTLSSAGIGRSAASMSKKPLFLLCNDDGVHAPGIKALAMAIEKYGDVIVVAPHVERSGSGQGLSLTVPLRMERLSSNTYAVEGLPTDCMIFALNNILDRKPDWVLSGINRGSNIGQDVLYSGTVAAAMEGVARNPGAYKNIFTSMIIGLVFMESLVLYAVVIVFVKI